jgi:hypothetical protein
MESFKDTPKAAEYIWSRTGCRPSIRTLESWRSRGSGPRFLRVAGRIAYRQSDLDDFIESCVVEPSEVRTNVG